ncbi:hypothetical protein ACH4TC_18445 [Streptomyces spororaveus]|uniref:hypothetical protein n=1 Tax=Streptomyces spororaveus TaxID=284039 RepID=UPI0037A36ECE
MSTVPRHPGWPYQPGELPPDQPRLCPGPPPLLPPRKPVEPVEPEAGPSDICGGDAASGLLAAWQTAAAPAEPWNPGESPHRTAD